MTKLAEFKQAIRDRVFVRATDNVRIIGAGSAPKDVSWIFDFRAVILDPQWLDTYAELFWERHAHKLPFQVGGLETAAIPLISAIVMKGIERGTPVSGFYIRKSRDRDGLMKMVEGRLTDEPVILVDDLINSGNSFNRQIKVLEDLGKRLFGIFVLLAFRAPEAYAFAADKSIDVSWLFTLKDFGLPLESAKTDTPRVRFDQLWRFAAPQPSFDFVIPKSAPIIDEKYVYIGSDRGTFYALRQDTGAIVWSFDVGKHPKGKGIFSTPVLHDETLYFGAYDGVVYALDAKSGKERWSYSGADWIGSSPAIAPDLGLLFIGLEFGLFNKRGSIVALDLKTGERRWLDRTHDLTHGSPLYIKEEHLVVIGSNDGVLYAYDAKSGTRKWVYQSGADIKTRAAYDPIHHQILVASMDSKLYALDVQRGSPRWAYQTGAAIYSTPLVRADLVYIASLDKSLYAIDLATGTKRWEFQTSGRIFASPLLVGGALWIGSNDGRVYELDPSSGTLRGSHQFSERVVNAVAYNEKTQRFFVPTVANELYCIKRRDITTP